MTSPVHFSEAYRRQVRHMRTTGVVSRYSLLTSPMRTMPPEGKRRKVKGRTQQVWIVWCMWSSYFSHNEKLLGIFTNGRRARAASRRHRRYVAREEDHRRRRCKVVISVRKLDQDTKYGISEAS